VVLVCRQEHTKTSPVWSLSCFAAGAKTASLGEKGKQKTENGLGTASAPLLGNLHITLFASTSIDDYTTTHITIATTRLLTQTPPIPAPRGCTTTDSRACRKAQDNLANIPGRCNPFQIPLRSYGSSVATGETYSNPSLQAQRGPSVITQLKLPFHWTPRSFLKTTRSTKVSAIAPTDFLIQWLQKYVISRPTWPHISSQLVYTNHVY